MKNIDEIKKKIHTANPIFTDEVMDLLYEYVYAVIIKKNEDDFQRVADKIQHDENFNRRLQRTICKALDEKR